MSDLVFDRDAVGVSAKRDWTDAATIGEIAGSFVGVTVSGVATPVGEYLASGASALEAAVGRCFTTVQMMVAECSDAAAILGSGQESAIADMDATESASSGAYQQISERMGGPTWVQPI
ncbi:MAG: hypothetical protein Q4D89_09180 [Arachnia propionica]|uniref:hypothetical protein n=1 Tax=Arachnia propionica TaxID=1750 RepID=UPI0026F83AD0|nr:hypothetical protein [Arachnia propionica]